ncbi:MAG: hypothetical protein QOI10_361 [Solirubrobacterales bacterium]|nr:hypothetical protein [Solirubrobacterales bacterium]
MIETLLLEIGSSATGAIFRFWLQSSEVAQGAISDVDELIRRFARAGKERRALHRELERISEQIADRLAPFFETEFGGLPENEKIAAGHEVCATLDRAPISDALLFATDLEPQALDAEIRGFRPQAAEEAHLSEAGTAFYDFLLGEISNYIVEIRLKLPDFGSESARVMLRRETELIELVKTVLDRLPAQVSGLGGGEAAVFEAQYRRDVARKLDQLELFGVTTAQPRSRYSLSVAYLTLTAAARLDRLTDETGGEAGDRDLGAEQEEDEASIPVDEALGRRNRVLIRGEAGSGKTTLLQWLAVNSARGSFDGALADWNDSVPFLLQLRRFVDVDLPQISNFTTGINQHTSPPEDWAVSHLRDGTALVLVDGIDELPEEKRQTAHEWLVDLVAAYPDARYVLTSRPPAVGDDWLAADGFESVVLEPMGLAAISAFVDHWHNAIVASVSDLEETQELEELAESLKGTVRETRSIRNLASSPLLCAMLCALNRDRRAQIPSDRIELYRIALEMLLERRDVERRVKGDIAQLGLREKEILLRVFALWLLNNSRSDSTTEDLVALVQDRLEGMPRVDASAEEVTKHLLLRSGLLRQPVEGRVDFIHRTFQEYLAAKEAVETRSAGMLLEHAHQDQWQEVVVLAAGVADLSMREALIKGLIERGDGESLLRHRLHLLAVGCLDTSAELSPQLTGRVDGLLQRLIPPRNLTEAKAIASAGELAATLLGKYAVGSTAVTAAACVRALSLIGGDSALVQLEKFGPDRRVTVARALVRAWEEFPTEEYARRVLSHSRLDYGEILVSDPAGLQGIASMANARSLICDGSAVATPAGEWPWEAIAQHPALAEILLVNVQDLTMVPPLQQIPKLSTLGISQMSHLTHIADGELPDLEGLSLALCPRLTDVSGIAHLSRLRALRLNGIAFLDELPPLPAALERLSLWDVGIEDLSALAGCASLQVLSLDDCQHLLNVDELARLPSLRVVLIDDAPEITDLSPLSEARQLEVFALQNPGKIDDASALGGCTSLGQLAIEDTPSLEDVTWLGSLDRLQVLSLADCTGLNTFPAIELPELRRLFLSGCTGISELEWVASLPALEELHLGNCSGITDLGPLRELKVLSRLAITNCDAITDFSVLEALPELSWLDARGCSDKFQIEALEEAGVNVRMGPTARILQGAHVGLGWNWSEGWLGI